MWLRTALANKLAACLLLLGALGGCHPQITQPTPLPSRQSFSLLRPVPPSSADDAPLAAFFDEAERLIPQRVKQAIARPIAVGFDDAMAGQKIRIPVCAGTQDSAGLSLAAQELGRSHPSHDAERPHQILLHPDILSIARLGSERSVRFACGHGSLYRLALATLLHEVAHVYDAVVRLSGNPVYQRMQQFAPQGASGAIRAHNQLRVRSPDIYEFHDLTENLAVNFEYFIFDPTFKCRRPAVYRFLADTLNHEPFLGFSCTVNPLIYAGSQPAYLDPARVYQIHYLFAARGKGIASRFGHSMFRIVMCSPARQQVDVKCLEDLHDHLVLSFVANLRQDLTIDTFKGLTGKYMSQLMIRPLTEVLNEYAEVDYRDLQSLPLRMNQPEIQQFVHHALELYWSYSGRYYFLSNNCADESQRLLQSAMPAAAVQSIDIMTPVGLRDNLIKKKVADESVIADRAAALNRGYLFLSALTRYQELYDKFRDKLPGAPRSLESYIKKTKASKRREWVNSQAQNAEAVSGLYSIEGLILQRLMKEIEKSVVAKVLLKRDPRYAALGQKLQDYLHSLRLPWELVDGGYGIPLLHEFKPEPREVRPDLPEQIIMNAMSLIKVDDADLFSEYVQTEQNRQLFLSMILQSSATHRAGASR